MDKLLYVCANTILVVGTISLVILFIALTFTCVAMIVDVIKNKRRGGK